MNMSNLKLRNVQYLLAYCLTAVSLCLGLLSMVRHSIFMRMPGRLSGVPMNSMPAASRALLRALIVFIDAFALRPSASSRLIVFSDRPALTASS